MRELRGRTALITGASRGIGAKVARALAQQGMNLALAARSPEALEQLATELQNSGVRAVAFPTDVADETQLVKLVDDVIAEFGTIDVLVNNAGAITLPEASITE